MNFLEKLIPVKRAEIEQLKHQPPTLKPIQNRPGFTDALESKKGLALIAEIKLHSPSKGHLAHPEIIDTLLPLYNKYATAISVLTDNHFFKGNFTRLNEIAHKSDRPIICKDFIIDSFQIELAKQAGASAILLIAKLLSLNHLHELYKVAKSHNLDILLETHDEEDLEKALNVGAKVIGINHRNLQTLEIDMQTSHRLRPLIPEDKIVIAESGIHTPADIAKLPEVDGVLIGTSIVNAEQPESLIKSLCEA
ncbi:MAG: indole-3-glycerol phosphate synthase TrpC [Candidatus Peregrinibacteria bacterium]|nr:indole-3-glycerol phosphate synthase TrpC [Candidatus Peregrinibacteria bacterium]